ncbi:MAG TPA: enoyl-CoA hydratase-related protein [Galbitalea sp.]|nr:enoyl-CoA hydratase-related protein [Galbitalea sp.]
MSETASLERRGSIFILSLGDTENRFNFDSVSQLISFLDQVDAAPGDKALVTIARGKFWSNGLDLDWMIANKIELTDLVVAVQELFARVLEASYPTVAVIQGHCYAAGGMLALAHDVRFMREDRGFLCFPEVDIKMRFTPGMNSLLTSKLSAQTAHQAMVLGRRYTAPEAEAAGIVDGIFSETDLETHATAYAESLAGKDAATIASIKKTLYAQTLALLRSAP